MGPAELKLPLLSNTHEEGGISPLLSSTHVECGENEYLIPFIIGVLENAYMVHPWKFFFVLFSFILAPLRIPCTLAMICIGCCCTSPEHVTELLQEINIHIPCALKTPITGLEILTYTLKHIFKCIVGSVWCLIIFVDIYMHMIGFLWSTHFILLYIWDAIKESEIPPPM